MLIGLTSGCSDGPDDSGNSDASEQTDTTALLENGIGMLQPSRMGISAETESALATLNDWLAEEEKVAQLPPIPIEKLRAELDDEQIQALQLTRFVPRDCDHIVSAICARKIADNLQAGARNDQERIERLFEYVIHNIALVDRSQFTVPLNPFECLVFGVGSPQDRAWVLAELCRQLYFDVVILQLPETDPEAERPWLVGVCMGDDLLLFDMRQGIPVPSAPEADQPAWPLTAAGYSEWSQADYDWSIFAAKADPAPAIDLQQLKNATALIVSSSDLWSQRIRRLQTNLTGERAVVVYQALFEIDGEIGAFERVRQVLSKTLGELEVGIWSYPDQQIAATQQLNDTQQATLLQINQALEAPHWELKEKSVAAAEIAREDRAFDQTLRKARLHQLTGDLAEATKSYQNIRYYVITRLENPAILQQAGPDMLRANLIAHESSTFFSGICQLSGNDLQAALGSLRQYQRDFPQHQWTETARYLEIRTLADLGRYSDAVQLAQDDPITGIHEPAVAAITRIVGPAAQAARAEPDPSAEPDADDKPDGSEGEPDAPSENSN